MLLGQWTFPFIYIFLMYNNIVSSKNFYLTYLTGLCRLNIQFAIDENEMRNSSYFFLK